MKFKIIRFSFLLISIFAQAQVEDQLTPVSVDSIAQNDEKSGVDVDSLFKTNYTSHNELYPKKVSPNFKNKYTGREFDYTTLKTQESLLDKIKRKLNQLWNSVFGNSSNAVSGLESFLKILGVLVIGVALYFIIRFLFGKEGGFFFSKKNTTVNVKGGVLHENIHEINFPARIAEFEMKKEYRSAIRYHFLFMLKNMSDLKIIQWNPEKTNTDYIEEIKNDDHKKSYQQRSYIFENVWYGEQDVDETRYLQLKRQFVETSFKNSGR